MITHSGGATRFFWSWLIGSAAFSILGVVTHAMLGSARSSLIASVLAVGIVVIQLCATYGVHALVQERITGAAYRWALAIAIALALGAFVLNFVALQDLVITWAGTAPAIAWIVPLIIDLGMTASTLAILALTEAQRTEQLHTPAHPDAQAAPSVHVEVHNTVHADAHAVAQPVHAAEQVERAAVHAAIATRLTDSGVVRIAPERVVRVLDAHADGVRPGTIARSLGVGFSTVKNIVAAVAVEGAGSDGA
ncbi:Protein of uncharacterised function (DUF2637) [Mycobacteroides abscessus subsp. abscessus]|uniref:DUF2637 domain-containing protein n=1 Tax=Mycobacteroides abscessus TaxID=36809 RepID=UPI00092A9BCD|nr:DUF2637 domain-containing protein [Mycobacteroides abscessus]MDO3083748.1 DUF2637 domain-containing protein [Mycobacteroides abscessus subsp. abscessus]SHP46524.1 Protein of uncharacterised function (DUF2637) [Mycobacteroides abscessus subsp. abscessus]SHV76778.1 Protein of uncharacterised function (DUF2637) [Mycobacteroides abscessus subsp. abscessus]SHY52588.1 Protein of uncharacterised function (DUF2637) [Mycobacteroides abscessus subsp. abscessus]SHZ43088.1 Protein of uncharacterised fu